MSDSTARTSVPATWGLCGLCVAVWLWEMVAWLMPFLPLGGSGIVFSEIHLPSLFVLRGETLAQGALWQPLTYALNHGNALHLALNLFGLSITGATLERVVGSWRTLTLFALGAAAGACGFLASLHLDPRLPTDLACWGVSGVVTACIGAATALAWGERVTLWVLFLPIRLRAGWLLPIFLLLSVCEVIFLSNITAYGAHAGGWLMGLALGALWRRAL